MTKQEIQNEIIDKVISPLIVAALKQDAFEQKYKAKKIKFEEIETPLQEIVDTFDTNKMKEVVSCIQWYEDHMKNIINYIKKPMVRTLNELPEDEYKAELVSEYLDTEFVIETKTAYTAGNKKETSLEIKKKYAISDEVMPTIAKIDNAKIAEAIANGETSVMDAIKAGAITSKEKIDRSINVKIKESNE